MQLSIPDQRKKRSSNVSEVTLTPLSPIAFNIFGPKELRKRREEELERRMKDLGFVEQIPPPLPPKDARKTSNPTSRSDRRIPPFSAVAVESENDRDIVLLVDDVSDVETEELPVRSESRAAMLTLFTNAAPSPVDACTKPPMEIAVDVRVETVMSGAVNRTKHRFSRKWVREQRGKRWTEKDFSEILYQLRMLR
ncbi:hypothetical protein BN946_scf184747.g37 [Trametes cinnabarina]|uniref:Uncharacterized protein n=1 Tax=Pycnoporus cinnabarinus TaxID=5643 RepID=A0A060SYA5_PYCCI|nr:hypothetical protein BN946_scf184747.g37 [Trametes cinnabarina]